MSNQITMKYGTYTFRPVPSFSYSRAIERTPGNNFTLSTPIQLELNGSIVTTGFGNVSDAISDLSSTFKNGDCNIFSIQCSGEPAFISGYAKITNLNIQPRNDGDLYVNTASYTISLEMVSLSGNVYDTQPSGITAISEDWNIEFLDERVAGQVTPWYGSVFTLDSAYQISHNITVTSPYQCRSTSDITGWVQASNYIINNMLTNQPESGISGIFLPIGMKPYNHFRVLNKNPHEGTVTLNETWVAAKTGAIEEFDVNVDESIDNALVSVTVNGTIQGLANISYPSASGTPKLHNAFQYWNSISGSIYSRAQTVYNGSLNIKPLSRSLGYNTLAGTVTYNYSYNNRPNNCSANALSEVITITENNPNDIFASLTILGRAKGPLHQSIGTFGPRTRELSIEALLPIVTGCSYAALAIPTDYNTFISDYEAGLSGDYSQVFVSNQSKTWNPKEGRFTFTKSWTLGEC